MAIQVSSTTVINNSRKALFTSMNPGSYTTATRPTTGLAAGDIIYNSTDGKLQVWDGSSWSNI